MSGSQFIAGYFTPIGGGGRPDNTLPGQGGSAGQLPGPGAGQLPSGGGNYPSHPIAPGGGGGTAGQLPSGGGGEHPDQGLPPRPDNSLPPGTDAPPGIWPTPPPNSPPTQGYIPMYVRGMGWKWIVVPLPHPDHGLPPLSPGQPDQGLPGGGEHPDQGLPGQPPRPDQGLPGQPPHPDQGLPGGGNYPSQGLPGQPGHLPAPPQGPQPRR